MIKVTFEFPSVEHALVAMGKLAGLTGTVEKKSDTPAKIAAREATTNAYKPASELLAKTPGSETTEGQSKRKPRADAGKKRGSYKNPEHNVAPPNETGAAATEPTAVETKVAPVSDLSPAAQTSSDPAPIAEKPVAAGDTAVPTIDECQALIVKYHDKFTLTGAMSWLAQFDVKRCRDLPAAKRSEFVAKTLKELAK